MSDEEDIPQLSQATLLALQEFLYERDLDNQSHITENWQLSQFWYDENTIKHLSEAAVSLCNENSKIALISCPSLYKSIKFSPIVEKNAVDIKLFEFDKRFSSFGNDFVFYDYHEPLNVDVIYKNLFDVIVVDPPFLSDECLSKTAQTVYFLGKKPNVKIILCTGAVMKELANKLLNVKPCSFKPLHKNNLANEFICLTNFGELR